MRGMIQLVGFTAAVWLSFRAASFATLHPNDPVTLAFLISYLGPIPVTMLVTSMLSSQAKPYG